MYKGSDILPAVLRPGMYAGERGTRTEQQWISDAVASYLNESVKMLCIDPKEWAEYLAKREDSIMLVIGDLGMQIVDQRSMGVDDQIETVRLLKAIYGRFLESRGRVI